MEGKIEKFNYSHIVLWGSMYEKVKDVLHDYAIVKEIFHAYWIESFVGYEKDVYFLILAKN